MTIDQLRTILQNKRDNATGLARDVYQEILDLITPNQQPSTHP